MRKKRSRVPILLAVVLSVSVHLGGLHVYAIPQPDTTMPEEDFIELVELPKKPVVEKKKQNKDPKGKIVDLGPEDDTEPPPEQADYLAARNMRADKETVKRGGPIDGAVPLAPQINRPGSEKESERESSEGESKRKLDAKNREDFDGSVRVDTGKGEDLTKEDLMLSMADIKRQVGPPKGNFEYLPEVSQGDITVLNAQRYAHAAFFNRWFKIIRVYWNPFAVLSPYDIPQGRHRTDLRITVLEDGTITDVAIINTSGYTVIDEVAVRAVKKSSPVPDVPKAIIEDGRFIIEIGFIVDADYR